MARRPQQGRWRRWLSAQLVGRSLLVGLLLIVLAAPSILQALGRAPDEDYSAGGYTRLVNRLITARHWLMVDYRDQTAPTIRFADQDLARNRTLGDFVKKSFLKRDMETADPGVWVFDDEGRWVQRIRPEAHRVIGPFANISGWTGDILFKGRQARTPVIFDQDGSRYVLSAARPASPGPALDQIQLFQHAAAPAGLLAPRFELMDRKTYAGMVMLVGDRVFLRVSLDPGLVIKLNGTAIVPRDSRPRLVHWPEGETVTLQRGRWRQVLTLSSASPAISASQGGRLRLRFPGLESLAGGVEASMEARDRNDDVATTLDAGIQAAAQRALDRNAEQLRAGGRAFPGALLVMDARTGEVLAAATYPSKPEQLDAVSRRSVQPPDILTRNQNFVRLPIGSVAKAPISLAILKANPALADLRIEPRDPFDNVLGVDMGVEFSDHLATGSGEIDFTRFLQKSSNRYAAALMLMALDPTPTDRPGERYYLGGSWKSGQLAFPIVDHRITDTGQIRWKFNLASLFDIKPDGDLDGSIASLDSARFWGPLARNRRYAFESVTPEPEALGLNDIRNIATDYIMTILGGNRSRWTTVKVAESFSRMVTRTPVQAHILDGLPAYPPKAATGAAFVQDEAWGPVMKGLKAVASDGGTAHALQGSVEAPAGLQVRLFAKTGTPATESYTGRTAANQALQDFAAAGCGLVVGPQGLALRSAPAARSRRELLAALGSAEADCADDFETRLLIAGEIVRLNRGARGGGLAGLVLRGEHDVVGVPVDAQVRTGLGHVVAVVVGLYNSADDPDDRPVRALTVVVNLQKRVDSDKTPAIQTAKEVLQDPVVRAWLRRPARPVGGAGG